MSRTAAISVIDDATDEEIKAAFGTTVYRFRCASPGDVERALAFIPLDRLIRLERRPQIGIAADGQALSMLPDQTVTLELMGVTLQELRARFARVRNGEVMWQSLNYAEAYDGTRYCRRPCD